MTRNEVYLVKIRHVRYTGDTHEYHILARNAREAGSIAMHKKGRYPKCGWWISKISFVCQIDNLNHKER